MTGLTMKYFVLKPRGDDEYAFASRMAMQTYASHIEQENPELCQELHEWVLCESIDENSSTALSMRDKHCHEYSQGVCHDGAAIFCDGQQLTIEEILERLRGASMLEIDARRYRKLRQYHWSDGGIAVLEKAEDAKLCSMTLSLDRLDAAIDANVLHAE